MRNFLPLFLAFTVIVSFVKAQHIPDANFAAAIRQQCPTCINANDSLLPDAAIIGTLNVSSSQIANLAGIAGFTALRILYCQNNQLTSLPLFPNTITHLNCAQNLLATLPPLPSSLTDLQCQDNQLTSLSTLPIGIETLNCSNNQLTNLPALTQCSSFNLINCAQNQLTMLPALPNSLTTALCADNQLTYITNLPANLGYINCRNNPNLNCLPFLPPNIQTFDYANTNITCIINRPQSLSVFISLPICDANNNPNNCALVSTVADNFIQNSFQIFPNPNKGSFSLRFAESVSLENANLYIYNHLGGLVAQQKINNQTQQIETNNLPAAAYIVKVQAENATFVQKMIVE